jgi:hypothetical protein
MTEETTQFQLGDIVRPKLGGPAMRIRSIEGNWADCVYCKRRPKGWNQGDLWALNLIVKVERPDWSK